MPKNAELVNYKRLTFAEMVVEIHRVMWKINNGLKGSHPFASRPASWPALERGIKFWTAKIGNAQIYLVGNPIVWWLALASIGFYVLCEIFSAVLAQRSVNLKGLGKFL